MSWDQVWKYNHGKIIMFNRKALQDERRAPRAVHPAGQSGLERGDDDGESLHFLLSVNRPMSMVSNQSACADRKDDKMLQYTVHQSSIPFIPY